MGVAHGSGAVSLSCVWGGLGAFGPRAPQIKREGEDRGGARGPAFADAVPPLQLRSTVVYKKCWMGVGPRRRPGVR